MRRFMISTTRTATKKRRPSASSCAPKGPRRRRRRSNGRTPRFLKVDAKTQARRVRGRGQGAGRLCQCVSATFLQRRGVDSSQTLEASRGMRSAGELPRTQKARPSASSKQARREQEQAPAAIRAAKKVDEKLSASVADLGRKAAKYEAPKRTRTPGCHLAIAGHSR